MVFLLEEFGPLEIREVTLRLDGEIEITDKAALLELERYLVADIIEALFVKLEEVYFVTVYIKEFEGWEGVFEDLFVYKIIG
jgi:hypothetical protein